MPPITSRRVPLLLIAVLALVSVLTLAACSDDPEPTVARITVTTATATPVPTATPTPTPTSTPIPDPSIESFAAIPLTIEDGDSSTLDWTTTGASSVTISGVTGQLAADGRTAVRPAATTTYTLTATNEAGTEVSEYVTITVTYPIVSLDVNGTTILSSIGGASQMSVAASRSDGSSHEVDNSLVEWRSSDSWVVTVSQGMVTAVGTGNATITASYGEVEEEVPVSVRISERKHRTVRVLYASPSDREFRSDYSEAISHAIVDLQSWYRRQLGGLTFSLYDATPVWCQMSEPADFYATGNAWDKVVEGVQHCAPVQHNHPDFVWVVYAAVREACNEPHELGAGGPGLTILQAASGDFDPGLYYYCDEGPYYRQPEWVVGGLGHELAHAFGLPHPPGCDPWDPAKCDHQEASSLMHDGYTAYPETYLLPSDKETLIRSPFFDGEPTLDRDSIDTLSESTVRGAVLGPDGEASEGLWVSLIADSFWGWGETGRDGTFEIRLPEGSSGSSILNIHSGDLGDCGWRGYYGPGGFTTQRNRATSVEVGGANVTDIEVRLPVSADRLCNRQSASTIRGIMTTPDGKPVEGVWLWVVGAADLGVFTDSRGVFSIEVPDGSYGLLLDLGDRLVGWYDGQGITAKQSEAAVLEVAGWDIEDIEIRLPARPEDLPCVIGCSTPTPAPTATPTPVPTATPTPTAEERQLDTPAPARALLYANWVMTHPADELHVPYTIHNDVELRGSNGIFLMGCPGSRVNDAGFYFGFQTEVSKPSVGGLGKGTIFSRWYQGNESTEVRLADVRVPPNGWTESGDYEGNFVSVRTTYSWTEGRYVLQIRGAESDEDGRWFEFWIVDEAGGESWAGSLRFPLVEGQARIAPYCATTIELYGSPIRPSSVPYWRVTSEAPLADGVQGKLWRTCYPRDVETLRNVMITDDESGTAVGFEIGLPYIAHNLEHPC